MEKNIKKVIAVLFAMIGFFGVRYFISQKQIQENATKIENKIENKIIIESSDKSAPPSNNSN
jgi:hypothetical protein